MTTISYTESIILKQNINKINLYRQSILLSVISPIKEINIKWQSTIDRLYWIFSLDKSEISRGDIAKLFRNIELKPFSIEEQSVLNCKNTLDIISHDFLASQAAIVLKDIVYINQKLGLGSLNIKADLLKNTLSYFNTSNEHPIIQAGLIYFQIYALSPYSQRNTKFSSLMSYLFLYKEGFDIRGLLVIEEYFRRNYTDYKLLLDNTISSGNQTLWLEFYSKALINALEKVEEKIDAAKNTSFATNPRTKLNNRQKEILSLLDEPSSTINNRQVQHIFKISQITASRDLAKLSSLLLIFPHGRGRSVYYTKL